MPSPGLSALPPKEAIKHFKSKGYAVGFDYRDVWKEEHAVAFTAAKAMRIDILEDIRDAMDRAMAKGVNFQDFQKNLRPILKAKGWWGRGEMADPLTGEIKDVQLGSARRLRTIFDTNMRTAQSAGRWERIQRVKEARPYLRYVAVQDDRTRAQHAAWHGVILPVDHEFWDSHYPPNGWRCRCTVAQMSKRDLDRRGEALSPDPAVPRRLWANPRNDQVESIPIGIDPGFDYNVGKARLRAFTPPPSGGGLPETLQKGVKLPRLPAPRIADPARLIARSEDPQDYVRAFLKEFDADIGRDVIFTDKAGESLVLSQRLFVTETGRFKGIQLQRWRYFRYLADTIKEPDEIWWRWQQDDKGLWRLRRRYLARFILPDQSVPGLVVFENGKAGWSGTTAFPPHIERSVDSQNRYIGNQRGGLLAFRRKE